MTHSAYGRIRPRHASDPLDVARDEVQRFRERLRDAGIPFANHLDRSLQAYTSYHRGVEPDDDGRIDGWTVHVTQSNGREAAVTFPCRGAGQIYIYHHRSTVGPVTFDERTEVILVRYLTTSFNLGEAANALGQEAR